MKLNEVFEPLSERLRAAEKRNATLYKEWDAERSVEFAIHVRRRELALHAPRANLQRTSAALKRDVRVLQYTRI